MEQIDGRALTGEIFARLEPPRALAASPATVSAKLLDDLVPGASDD